MAQPSGETGMESSIIGKDRVLASSSPEARLEQDVGRPVDSSSAKGAEEAMRGSGKDVAQDEAPLLSLVSEASGVEGWNLEGVFAPSWQRGSAGEA